MNTASDNGKAEAKIETLACGQTTPHTQDYYGRPPPIGGQPPIFGGHAPSFGYPPPYGQVMQPVLYGQHLPYGAVAGNLAPSYHLQPSPNPVGDIGLPQAFVHWPQTLRVTACRLALPIHIITRLRFFTPEVF